AIIAGARRVGVTVARRLATEGVRLAIVYRQSQAEAQRLQEMVRPLVERTCIIQADLADEGDVARLVAEARSELGDLSFSVKLAPHGILVNGILPGPTARPPDESEAEWQSALSRAPLHRESSAEEMAELVVALLKMETITGENIRVDSGRHLVGTGTKDEKI